ncbi:mandelate racemase/muconate lactonizing enzyme family protein [Paenibacillus sp. 11B]|nr:mandelate racemase/muconate lactonizing enzyme family protein [Paenibacillus sp. 11B]
MEVKYFNIPLEENLVDALHGKHDSFELITATIVMEDGRKGTGYTYTGGIGGTAIYKLLVNDLIPRLVGREFTTPDKMNAYMNQCIHYVARGGIASFAISALDIALWDIKLKTENMAICDLYGTRNEKVRTYYGGIDLMLTEKELLQNIEKQLEKGHTAIKIKLGKENEDEDIERVKAVRNLIGKDAMFMVDANMIWTVPQAIRMAKRMEEFNIAWLEEPTNPDDYEGYARIGQATTIPIAMGENLHTIYEHKLALDIARIKYPIPDCSNVCGITGFLKVGEMAKERSLKVSSHGMQELHVNVLGALSNAGFLEYHSFPICDYTIEPLKIVNGYIEPSKATGVGINFDWEKLKKYEMIKENRDGRR